MANNNQIYKMSNTGGFKSLNRYYDMLAGNTVWNPWEPDGAYDALSTVTVDTSAPSSVTFTGIPSNYKHLQIRIISRRTIGVNSYVNMRMNSDSGVNYSWHELKGDGANATSAGYGSSSSQTYMRCFMQNVNSTNIPSQFGAGIIDILDYANTSNYKTMRSLGGNDMNGSGQIALYSGSWRSASAINSLTFYFDADALGQYSQFSLYGVK